MRTLKAALLATALALAGARIASDCEKAAPASLSRALREQLCSGSTGAGLLGVSLSSRAYLSKPLASRSPHALPSAALSRTTVTASSLRLPLPSTAPPHTPATPLPSAPDTSPAECARAALSLIHI